MLNLPLRRPVIFWACLAAFSLLFSTQAHEWVNGELVCRGHGAAYADAGGPPNLRYAPDRRVDVAHMTLDVTPDFQQGTVKGTVTYTFRPISQPLAELRLDGVELTVHSVKASEKVSAHQVTGAAVIITFAKPIPPGKESSVTVSYEATPQKGLYFRTPAQGYAADSTHVWTQGETHEARHWYPGFDFPNEKLTTELICHVPDGMTVLSNGRQVSSEKNQRTGLTAVRWRQDKPHVNYLVTLVAGHFRKLEDRYRNIPLTFYTPPGDIAEAPNSLRGTKEMMAFFEKEIGVPYPWDQYGQVVVHDFHWGGMENTGMTTLTDRTLFRAETENIHSSEGLVAHELAHQWFGDLVTCKDWSHIWLNEGFATYYAHLWDEHAHGRDEMNLGLLNTLRALTSRTDAPRAIVSRKFDSPDDQFRKFGHLAYGKGGWVLHMLRSQLGEELYRRCIKTYTERRQFDNAVTADLLAVIEELSGRSFDVFFDQWLYHAHHPELDVTYAWDEKTKLARISVRQVQKINADIPLFRFPLPVRFHGSGAAETRTFEIREVEQDFYVPLRQAPERVRIDPDLTVLAKIAFKPSPAMLQAQLTAKDDMLGRWLAVEELAGKKDAATVAKLKTVLNGDASNGVRSKVADSLRKIHTDEALTALTTSTRQSDARVRNAVMQAINGFHHPAARDTAVAILGTEKNPAILATAISGLGAYSGMEIQTLLAQFLRSDSYRNRLADAAITALRRADDPAAIPVLMQTLQTREAAFMSRGFAAGLDALAFLARNEKDRRSVRDYLTSLTRHPKEAIQVGALKALGTLEDPQALPVLEAFSTIAKDTPQQKEAEKAIELVKGARPPADNLKTLRQEVLDLQKENRRLNKDFEDLKKKLEAKPAK